jgi:hypothetical protein
MDWRRGTFIPDLFASPINRQRNFAQARARVILS